MNLGIGASTVIKIVKRVSRIICEELSYKIAFSTTKSEIHVTIDGLEKTSGLPFVPYAMDDTHI